MKKQILTKEQMDRRVSEMWDNLPRKSDDPAAYEIARRKVTDDAAQLQLQYAQQQDILQKLWDLAHEMCPDDPDKAATILLDNSQALKVIANKTPIAGTKVIQRPETIGTL